MRTDIESLIPFFFFIPVYLFTHTVMCREPVANRHELAEEKTLFLPGIPGIKPCLVAENKSEEILFYAPRRV